MKKDEFPTFFVFYFIYKEDGGIDQSAKVNVKLQMS